MALLSAVAFFAVLVLSTSSITPVQIQPLNLAVVGEKIVSQYWFPAVVLVIALLTTMIEALSLARRD